MMNKHNDLKKMVMMGFVSAIATQVCKPIIEEGFNVLKNNLIYTVSIDDAFGGITDALQKVFPNYPSRIEVNMGETYPGEYRSERVKMNALQWGFAEDFIDITFYRGTPIVLKINKFVVSEHGQRNTNGVYLLTWNQKHHIQNLKEFIEDLGDTHRQLFVKERMECKDYNVRTAKMLNGQLDTSWTTHKLRTFDNVFLPKEQKETLINAIDAYVNNRDFYVNNNLPNHFGILLYSKPGFGKSSIAQAIADHINAELFVASGDSISHIEEIMDRMGKFAMDDSLYRVLLFEDIDSGLFNLTRKKKDKDENKNEVGMATILNALDGINAPSNTIYVFTTNHIEALDPAFIRPGRCDLHMEIPPVTDETFHEFIQFHYPDLVNAIHYPEGSHVKEGLTFAELQTHVMKGETLDEVIRFAYDIK